MVQILFPQIQQAPGPNFRKVGKSLYLSYETKIILKSHFQHVKLKNLLCTCDNVMAVKHRGSYMSAHVLLNLLKELGKG